MKKFIIILITLTTFVSIAKSQTQADSSDKRWKIVVPTPKSIDVDMLQCLVNDSKDSVVSDFVQNIGTWKFRVDSIYFRGSDAGAFFLVSGKPKYIIESSKSHLAEFKFSPTEAKVYIAEIVIITQADTLIQNIKGEGVGQELEILENIIDFGIVEVGKFKDTLKTVTIKNIGSTSITITNTKHNYPNDIDFTTIKGGGNFTLNPNETKLMDLRFTPSDEGRTTGTLEFHYNGTGSPAVIQLFGEGINKKPKIQSSITLFDDLLCENESINQLILKNEGVNDLIIHSLDVIGTNYLDFKINQSLPLIIKQDSIYSLPITFKPQTAGNKVAELEIKSNADPDSLLTIDLIAKKDNVKLSSTNEIDLGTLYPNETKDFNFQIENLGTIETIAKLTTNNDIQLSNTSIRINAGNKGNIQGLFKGISQEGSFNRTITITDTCGNVQTINVKGIVESKQIQSSITPFSDLICKTESISKIEIRNKSGNNLIIKEMNVKGTNYLDFIINQSLPITIKPDSMYSLPITFRPQTSGKKVAELEIKYNAGTDSLLTIDLTATKDEISIKAINEIDLGFLCPNETKVFDFQIENLGTIETNAKLTADKEIQLSNPNIRINTGNKGTVQGQFIGIAQEGSFNRNLTITDTCGIVQTINVKGIIESPKLQVKDLEINSLVGKSKIEKIKIENTSVRDVIISSINGLNQPFSIIGNPFPLEILAKSSKEIGVEFTPIDQNPITQNVNIIGEPCAVIKKITIKGLAYISGLSISTKNLVAYPGDEIDVPIILSSSENLALSGVNYINTELIFNPTLLAPIGYTGENIDNKTAKIKIENIPISSNVGSTLTSIKFKVGLGNAESCDLTLDNAETIGGTADISLINGKFTLLGICEEGGTRLINPAKITKLMQISPNPSDGIVNVELNLVEKGNTILKVFSVSGEFIEEIMISNKSGKINIELDTKNYGNGLYFIHLQTPAINKIEKLIIYK